ncbi:MAG: AraC family transcriptional regulator [Pseudozobellia sp.]|nr:AraC family transcriptional regulator [Pseudozobellia sp.]|tara:strand:+ start:4418 stop:5296 length:879 start_codon:yes stop_codon:yes gene_type:complete
MKLIKAPSALTLPPYNQRELKLNGLSVVESCMHIVQNKGAMYLEDHMLLFVKKGVNILKDGKTKFIVGKNEMVFLKKATLVEYHKMGDTDQDNQYISLMFFLKDEFLWEFLKMTNIKSVQSKESVRILVKAANKRLLAFFESIEPYFNEPENIDSGLIKIKMLELLYDLAGTDKNLFQQLLQMKQPLRTEIPEVMEKNYTSPVSLTELAYLSGRSLASFKRDFLAIYNMPPSKWIRKKRLDKAKEILKNTSIAVSDICYSLGYENPAHFSRIFKEQFGHSPTKVRREGQECH